MHNIPKHLSYILQWCMSRCMWLLDFRDDLPVAQCNFSLCHDRLEVQAMLLSFCFEVLPEVVMRRECLVVLEEEGHPQASIEGLHFEAVLDVAYPLPPRMHSLRIEDMIRSHQESRSQKPEEGLVLPMTLPQEDRRVCCSKIYEALPQRLCFEEVFLESCLIGGPSRC